MCDPIRIEGIVHGPHDNRIMNSAACGRRLARPVRLTMAAELGGDDLDGAWWPYTASLASELPGLVDALTRRLGDVIDISVNWSSLAGSPDLDALIPRAAKPLPGLKIRHQRVMVITGSNAGANLMVVPCRTNSALAIMVLRLAAALPITTAELDTEPFRTADTIVRAARVESVLQRYRTIAASPSPTEPREVLSENGVPSSIGGPPR